MICFGHDDQVDAFTQGLTAGEGQKFGGEILEPRRRRLGAASSASARKAQPPKQEPTNARSRRFCYLG